MRKSSIGARVARLRSAVSTLGSSNPARRTRARNHLRVLKEAGIVSEEARGKWTFYAIDREAVAAALDAFRSILSA